MRKARWKLNLGLRLLVVSYIKVTKNHLKISKNNPFKVPSVWPISNLQQSYIHETFGALSPKKVIKRKIINK